MYNFVNLVTLNQQNYAWNPEIYNQFKNIRLFFFDLSDLIKDEKQ
jgi:hypothetical protein